MLVGLNGGVEQKSRQRDVTISIGVRTSTRPDRYDGTLSQDRASAP